LRCPLPLVVVIEDDQDLLRALEEPETPGADVGAKECADGEVPAHAGEVVEGTFRDHNPMSPPYTVIAEDRLG
jgi:hypothetical protein